MSSDHSWHFAAGPVPDFSKNTALQYLYLEGNELTGTSNYDHQISNLDNRNTFQTSQKWPSVIYYHLMKVYNLLSLFNTQICLSKHAVCISEGENSWCADKSDRPSNCNVDICWECSRERLSAQHGRLILNSSRGKWLRIRGGSILVLYLRPTASSRKRSVRWKTWLSLRNPAMRSKLEPTQRRNRSHRKIKANQHQNTEMATHNFSGCESKSNAAGNTSGVHYSINQPWPLQLHGDKQKQTKLGV